MSTAPELRTSGPLRVAGFITRASFDADCPFERTYTFDHESHGDPTEIHIAARRRD